MAEKSAISISAYTARMPGGVRDVMKELAYVTEISMNRITYDCIRANLRTWAERELSGEVVEGNITHTLRSLSLSKEGKEKILKAVDEALEEGDRYWATVKDSE